MITHDIALRVRYAETDQMGYVYYGNYASYLEVARVETFRMLGMSYRAMEEMGVMMPVLEYKTKYIRPAYYDDELVIKTFIRKPPAVRTVFEYEIYNSDGKLLNIAETTLVFVDKETGKPTQPPDEFQKLCNPFFKGE